jgi:GT2 family glycosyltransferase
VIVFACLVFAALLGLVVVQSILVWSFVRRLRNFDAPLISDSETPRAMVMLCLRGTDPFLKTCLLGLVKQDYPSYQVRIVVDSPEDPAHAVVTEVLNETNATNVRLESLHRRRSGCSLKCSAIRQVLDSLEQEFEIVAQLDADTIVHPTWLRELATALRPDDVGLATGNRWYMPTNPTLGSIVRYVWNAGAVVQMHWHQFAWGGCFAIKRRVLQESNLLKRWGRAFCDDTVLIIPVKKMGLRVEFVPSLMMINRENISLDSFYHWVCRQMLNVRLYHPAWPAVVIHGLISALMPLVAIIFALVAFWRGAYVSSGVLAVGLAIYAASLLVSLVSMVKVMRRIARSRGEPAKWISSWGMLCFPLVLPMTQAIHLAAIASASITKTVTWRGIRYIIDGPWKIRIEDYAPYQASTRLPGDESLG